MAKTNLKLLLIPLCVPILLTQFQVISAIRGKVGGRKVVENVKSNEEVQQLGRYCVREYNRRLQEKQEGREELLSFSEVVEAEMQVVAGIKYYLKISVATSSGVRRTFDAAVVVKPWENNSTELLDFAPSPSNFGSSKQYLDILVV